VTEGLEFEPSERCLHVSALGKLWPSGVASSLVQPSSLTLNSPLVFTWRVICLCVCANYWFVPLLLPSFLFVTSVVRIVRSSWYSYIWLEILFHNRCSFHRFSLTLVRELLDRMCRLLWTSGNVEHKSLRRIVSTIRIPTTEVTEFNGTWSSMWNDFVQNRKQRKISVSCQQTCSFFNAFTPTIMSQQTWGWFCFLYYIYMHIRTYCLIAVHHMYTRTYCLLVNVL